jgi:hypoxanthine phosphoribosyltransferase
MKIPIIGVSIQLYTEEDTIHEHGPQKFQWIDEWSAKQLKGKRILLVDEVDDTRTTLHYCVKELQTCGVDEISVLVIHNKEKTKVPLKGVSHYFACHDVEGDRWIVYPWEADDIEEHDRLAQLENKVNKH